MIQYLFVAVQEIKAQTFSDAGTPASPSEISFGTRISSRSRARRSRNRTRYTPKLRHLLSGADSVIAEKYNVRPNFTPLIIFQRGVRILLILMKAGGCFKTKPKLTGLVHIFRSQIADTRWVELPFRPKS